jgi:predicted dehydrogenase
MNRREFLQASAVGIAASASSARAEDVQRTESHDYDRDKVRRVGMIGCGWYGKSDLFRLNQVSPIEIVSLCDVDSQMLSNAAEMAASRQRSKKRPRTYSDYRKMLAEKDLDIVLIGTPDHWHALTMIEAVKSGADVWVQKPISVDVREGQAMLAAARKYNRVVQVGTQRRSTPHIIEARDRFIKEGKLGKIGYVEAYCYWHMRATGNPPDIAPPANLDYDFWTGPAPMRPFTKWTHPRGWRAFMEYGNGIMGDMGIHMFDMTRWMLDLPAPTRVSSTGGIFVDKASKANISDTQTATFDFEGMRVEWQHRTWGDSPYPKNEQQWGATFHGDKGTLRVSVFDYEFTPFNGGTPVHGDVVYELDKYPEDKTEKELEKHVAPAIRGHMQNLLAAIDKRGRPVADIEQGYISTAACILANNSMKLGRSFSWDVEKQEIANDQEGNRALKREYRGPWQHPSA